MFTSTNGSEYSLSLIESLLRNETVSVQYRRAFMIAAKPLLLSLRTRTTAWRSETVGEPRRNAGRRQQQVL